ncbi:MAG: hypothetical protein Q4P66_08600 [Actinomycetaceae bacterium]|nr:hypothetical protein [Actinomycetaceae bacterium]
MSLKRILAVSLTACLFTCGLSGCDKDDTATESPKRTHTSQADASEKVTIEETVFEAYTKILDNANSYSLETPSSLSKYLYALAHMSDDEIPELLLGSDDADGITTLRVFSYSEKESEVIEPEKTYNIGVAGAGGFRGGLVETVDENAILWQTWSAGTGEGRTERLELHGDTIETADKWEHRIDQTPKDLEEQQGEPIEFTPVDDRSLLEETFGQKTEDVDDEDDDENDKKASEPKAQKANKAKKGRKSHSSSQAEAIAQGRNVYSGTVRLLTCEEILDYQGENQFKKHLCPYEPGPFYIFVFSQPQTITTNSGDGSPDKTTRTSNLFLIGGDSKQAVEQKWNPYVDKTITISINQAIGSWPSGVTVPVGEPIFSDIEIID